MQTGKPTPRAALFFFLAGWLTVVPLQAHGGMLSFSKPQRLATLPWADGPNQGVPPKGPEWLMVDSQGRFLLESNLDFDVFDPAGKYLETFNPIDKSKNFYGFSAMESMPDGKMILLARLESSLEQWNKDNFEEHAKPGARLMVLDGDGKILADKELVDSRQPHSGYFMENGTVYSVHDDGTFEALEPAIHGSSPDPSFGNFAAFANSLEKWVDHLKTLPVFNSGNKIYHDRLGKPHEIKGASSFLMGHPFVEGVGPLAVRDGKIYYQVVCDKNQEFINSVFVESPKRKDYGLVELFRADQELDAAHGHALFVDRKGNLFEGVAKKDGYRIYEWKALP